MWRGSTAFLVLHQVVPATYLVEGLGTNGTAKTCRTRLLLVGRPTGSGKAGEVFVGIPDYVTVTVYETGAKQAEASSRDCRNCCFHCVLHYKVRHVRNDYE